MAEIAPALIKAVRRQRGVENLNVAQLAKATGIKQFTLYPIINGQRTNARPSTIEKLNAWLYTKI